MDFKVAATEVSKWQSLFIGESIYVEKGTDAFQELKLFVDTPEDGQGYDMPVKLRG
jgi:hypothetical protein